MGQVVAAGAQRGARAALPVYLPFTAPLAYCSLHFRFPASVFLQTLSFKQAARFPLLLSSVPMMKLQFSSFTLLKHRFP